MYCWQRPIAGSVVCHFFVECVLSIQASSGILALHLLKKAHSGDPSCVFVFAIAHLQHLVCSLILLTFMMVEMSAFIRRARCSASRKKFGVG